MNVPVQAVGAYTSETSTRTRPNRPTYILWSTDDTMGASNSVYDIEVDVKGTTKPLSVFDRMSVKELYEMVSQAVNRDAEHFLLYADSGNIWTERDVWLDRNSTKNLRDYSLRSRPYLTYKYNISPLEGFVKTSTLPCCVTLDDDEYELRAEMPCGCVISVDGLANLCESRLNDGSASINCPECSNVKWEFFAVRHILQVCKTPEELNAMADRLSRAYMTLPTSDIRQCPLCETYSTRDPTDPYDRTNPNRVACNVCQRMTGEVFEFCWQCGQQWIAGAGSKACGNKNCDGAERTLKMLAECATFTEPDYLRGCPRIRACPHCGCPIEHNEGCKHMTCKTCRTEFCFVCLRVKQGDRWDRSCAAAFGRCPVAKRQKTLPDPNNPNPVGTEDVDTNGERGFCILM